MFSKRETKRLSRELNLPEEYITAEAAAYESFIQDNPLLPEVLHDIEMVENKISDLIKKSEEAKVPYIKTRYKFNSAEVAAIYIIRNLKSDFELPPFYERALRNAEAAFAAWLEFSMLLVWKILQMAATTSVQQLIEYGNQVEKCFKHYRTRPDKKSEIYQEYESMRLKVGVLTATRTDLDRDEKVHFLKTLTCLQNDCYRMFVYGLLYDLYSDKNMRLTDTEDGVDIADSEFNPKTDALYLEEHLQEAYNLAEKTCKDASTTQDYTLVGWAIKVQYARWMNHEGLNVIPYNPEEAGKILQAAAKVDSEYVASRAKFYLEHH